MPFGGRRPLLPATFSVRRINRIIPTSIGTRLRPLISSAGSLPPTSSNLNMASSGKDIASSAMYAGTRQSLQLLVIRGIVDTETAYLNNIRALPTPADSADTFGLKGNLKYPPAILVHHIEADVTTYLTDLAPKFHPSFNSVAAAALLGVSHPILSVLRGADMERPGKFHTSVMTSDRLEATPGFRVGTPDHLETFGNQGLPGYTYVPEGLGPRGGHRSGPGTKRSSRSSMSRTSRPAWTGPASSRHSRAV